MTSKDGLTLDSTKGNKDHMHLMAIASLFDGDFSIDWLGELTGYKPTHILTSLEEEIRRKNIIQKGPGIYTFHDFSSCNELRNSLEPEKRRKFHNRIVDLLLRELPEDNNKAQVVSRHLLYIHNDLEKCRYLVQAGDKNLKQYKTEDAFQCYAKVLDDLSGLLGDDVDDLFVETAIKYSKISTARHDTDRVLSILKDALVRADNRDNKPMLALLEMHIAKNKWLIPKHSSALSHFERGWELVKELDDPRLLRSATTFNTFFLYWQGRFEEAVQSYEKIVPDVAKYPLGQFPLLAAITVGYCHAQIGQITQALGMFDAIRNHCLEKGDLYLAAYAAGMMGGIMLDIGRVDDALVHLEHSAKEALEQHNEWVLMTSHIMMAYAFFLKSDSKRCIKYLKEFLEKSRKVQATQHPYPYLMALLWAMEQGKLRKIKDLSLEKEIYQTIRDKNIYMKGVAYRYQALLQKKEGKDPKKIIQSLKQSIKWLKESGHQFGLARSRLELARVYLMLNDREKAKDLTVKASKVMFPLNEDLIEDDLRCLIDEYPAQDHLLKEILRIGQEIVNISDNKDLVNQVLSSANRMTGAERGALFLLDEEGDAPSGRLRVRASKNITSTQINHPDFSASMALIEEVAKTGEGRIKGIDPDDDSGFFSNETIRSQICVPMILRKKTVGVLYHDNRLLSSAFQKTDMEILSYFSAQVAFALDSVSAYNEIQRLNNKLRREKEYYEEEHIKSISSEDLIGKSYCMQKVLAQTEQVAQTTATALILGPTGAGKELIARAIHRQSYRKEKPFIKVHCSALSENLIASELFGHEKGSFTGAVGRKIGRFELADGGTLFLDEIGEISADLQIQLLRVLQTKEFERVGGSETLHSDFRLIAATNKNLEQEVKANRFRADLYYRLNVFPIHLPTLSERKEDIPLLAYHFLNLYSAKMGKTFDGIPEKEMDKLVHYDWPGNVRELENIIERGVILNPGPRFRMPDLMVGEDSKRGREGNVTLNENERHHILWALEKTGWKIRGKGGAAELLDIHPSTLQFRMKKLGIKRGKGKE